MAAALAIIGPIVSAAGSLVGGVMANNQAKAQAEAMEIEAGQRRASAQREAEQRRKEANLVLSRQQAVAAASGGGATDSTVLDLMARTGGQGELNAQWAQYQGKEEGRGLENQAAMTRAAGRNALFGSFIDAGTSMLSGFSNWQKYKSQKTGTSMPSGAGYYY